jgi:hypothetical protein
MARYLAADLGQKSGARLERLIKGVESEGRRFVAFMRLVPLSLASGPASESHHSFRHARVTVIRPTTTGLVVRQAPSGSAKPAALVRHVIAAMKAGYRLPATLFQSGS